MFSPAQAARFIPPARSSLSMDAYAEFQLAYDVFNHFLFRDELPPCLITLQRRDSRCFGYFSPNRFGAMRSPDGQQRTTHEIALNPILFRSHGPREALQTLAHEMVHLWQYHCSKPSRPGYHDKGFAAKMKQIGLQPSTTGKEGGKEVGQHMGDYVLCGGRFETIAVRLMSVRGGCFSAAWYDRAGQQASLPASLPAGIVAALADAGVTVPEKPKSKVAFTCPSCDARVWGKPSTSVLCGEHKVRMVPAS